MAFARFARRLFLFVVVLAVGLVLFHWARGHPQHLLWTPLSLADRVGRFTILKIGGLRDDAATCRALLDAAAEQYRPLSPVRGEGACGYADGIELTDTADFAYWPQARVACPVAVGLFLWEKQVVQPAAQRHFGQAVTRVDSFGSYACRPVRGGREGRWSEHASANAIDIAAFRLGDGRRIAVAAHWGDAEGDDPRAAFLREVRDGACGIFATVLSPDYNALHRDHLHLDQAARGGWSFCR